MTNPESVNSDFEIDPGNPPPTSQEIVSEPELRPWDVGKAVALLQELLNAHGFKLRVDGAFNSLTEAAVRVYQIEHQLRLDCIVDAKTWALLRNTDQPRTRLLRAGSIGADVYELQGLLNVNGCHVQRNSIFDDETQKGVIDFQQKHKLRANGKVGTITWNLLRGKPLPPPPKQTNWV
ncbi:MAG: peptidoglycan-binding protein [Phormidesmis sp. CAN_BIN36]|nr:peptidoglycan-binding protein [Phormidesmis sp. CAN_BIN36]